MNQLEGRLLLTGGGGFVGHHFLAHLLRNTKLDILAVNSGRRDGSARRITGVIEGRPSWVRRTHIYTHDLRRPLGTIPGGVDYIITMAGESEAGDSISGPSDFISSNTSIMLNVLELARSVQPRAVVVISTNEVYGPVQAGESVREWAPILPGSPYAASKAAQEAIAFSYWRTYGVPVIIINCMNLIGERQGTSKFLPQLIAKISRGETVSIFGRPGGIGTRNFLHARNLADGVLHVLAAGPPASHTALSGKATRPDRYNIAGDRRMSNLELAVMTAQITGEKLEYELAGFQSARPGHEPHYSLDISKITASGWKPPVSFGESLTRTVRWTLAHPEWLP